VRSAANFRGLLNDLKRDEVVAAKELGVDLETINKILAAEEAVSSNLIERAAMIWPVNERDFHVLRDDAPNGVVIMRAEDSKATSRVLQRGGKDYYEYRDTAMSRVTNIRPEWIRILDLVENNEFDNSSVRWNNGHFLYQFTYFIGDVNYYYAWEGHRYCEPMKTGDSVFGLPYAPHSFATRAPSAAGLILALTFGGRLAGDAQQELSVLPEDAPEDIATQFGRAKATLSPERLAALLNQRSYDLPQLVKGTALPELTVREIVAGRHRPDIEECQAIASALRLPLRELFDPLDDTQNGIRLVRGSEAHEWSYPAGNTPSYRIKELASSSTAAFAGGYEISPLKSDEGETPVDFDLGAHCYCYVIGTAPILLAWTVNGAEHTAELHPDDSVYIKPHVRHRFMKLANNGDSQMLTLRVGGRLSGDAACEASMIGVDGIRRLQHDQVRWFNS